MGMISSCVTRTKPRNAMIFASVVRPGLFDYSGIHSEKKKRWGDWLRWDKCRLNWTFLLVCGPANNRLNRNWLVPCGYCGNRCSSVLWYIDERVMPVVLLSRNTTAWASSPEVAQLAPLPRVIGSPRITSGPYRRVLDRDRRAYSGRPACTRSNVNRTRPLSSSNNGQATNSTKAVPNEWLRTTKENSLTDYRTRYNISGNVCVCIGRCAHKSDILVFVSMYSP